MMKLARLSVDGSLCLGRRSEQEQEQAEAWMRILEYWTNVTGAEDVRAVACDVRASCPAAQEHKTTTMKYDDT